MEKHITLLGVLHIISSAVGLLAAAFLFVLFTGISLLADEAAARTILFLFGIGLAGFLLLLTAPGLVGGIGILKRRRWARVVLLVVAVFKLPGFPFDTALGVYTLWVLMNDEVIALLDAPPAPPVITPPQAD